MRAAFLAVPRERFLPEHAAREGLDAVYRDDAVPTKFHRNGMAISSSSQPAIMAEMLEQLAVEPGLPALPRSRAVLVLPTPGIGVLGRDGRSLAYVQALGRRRVSRLLAHGGNEAENVLLAAVARWHELGRPTPADLRLVVDHARHGGVPRLRLS